MNASDTFLSRHERAKRVRVVFQVIILILLAYVLYRVFFVARRYEQPAGVRMSATTDSGFIAVSYFGVERLGGSEHNLISKDRLDAHIAALTASGYTPVSEQDIIGYYERGAPLPEKALFLMFEDGRRDTAIFALDVLEEHNCRAMMFSYADKFEKPDTKFLSTRDLLELQSSTYFDIGTNGYRLEYINVYDRYKNYIGRLSSLQFSAVAPYLRRDYDHYLMDFIRDEDGVPLESYEKMQQRVAADYGSMEALYTRRLGFMPRVYCLMHANSGMFGTHKLVSAENEKHIGRVFALNFNREGDSLNTRSSSVHDLTRIQPQAHWHTNHLLMRLWDDTGLPMAFVSGDEKMKADWVVEAGAAEFAESSVVITSLPSGRGLLRHAQLNAADVTLDVTLKGNLYGSQGVYLRSDNRLANYIYVGIMDRTLSVEQGVKRKVEKLADIDLFELLKMAERSIEEDKRLSKLEAQNAILGGDDYLRKPQAQTDKEALLKSAAATLEEGAEPYRPQTDLNDPGEYQLKIILVGGSLSVYVNGVPALLDQDVKVMGSGALQLEAGAQHGKFSQRNLHDDVYDGVFVDLSVTEPARRDGAEPVSLYDNRLDQQAIFWLKVERIYDTIVNWFIDVF